MIVPCTTCDSVGSLCGRCNDPDGSCNCTFPNSCDCHDCGGSGSIDHNPMTHKPNRTNVPPAKSADEYEREIAKLKLRIAELETLVAHYGWTPIGKGHNS